MKKVLEIRSSDSPELRAYKEDIRKTFAKKDVAYLREIFVLRLQAKTRSIDIQQVCSEFSHKADVYDRKLKDFCYIFADKFD